MIVFKNYFKIAKTYIPMIILNLTIFIFFTFFMAYSNPKSEIFIPSKPKILIQNKDQSLFTDNFIKYIDSNAEIVEIEETEIKDALFYRKVNLILSIPKNYSKDFLKRLNPKLSIESVPESSDTFYGEMLLNKYLNIASIYSKINMDEKDIVKYINKDFQKKIEPTLINKKEASNIQNLNSYFNFSNYTTLALCIIIVSMIMVAFKKESIKKRNMISPISYKKQNKYLLLSNMCIVFILWLFIILLSIIIYSNAIFTMNGLLFIINSFVFSILALTIGFIIGSYITNYDAISGIVNVIALGSSFLCGAFVPQEFLGPNVLKFAKILPSYWFIDNNNRIALLSKYNFETLKPIVNNLLILVIYIILFITFINVISKIKRKNT